MSAELDELKDLTKSLRRRVSLSDSSDWSHASANSVAVKNVAVKNVGAKTAAISGSLDELAAKIHACRACPLGSQRLTAVPGSGNAKAEVMFIGEGPGFKEDHTGEPFVGRSGQLLDKIMEAVGLLRSTVYIANIVKCHPMKNPADPESKGNDRPPSAAEREACRGWLDAQIRAIKPRFIVTLGTVPAHVLLDETTPITKLRGQWREYDPGAGFPKIKLLPTFHPAALLRNPNLKRVVWEDMKNLQKELSK